ncbi:MAG: hypothetical protein RMN25_11645 [Anaerolineae bacterium]|nr:hypothetical protein [Thermoflexales bacterium]MDW8408422.1 hypothetical protein [Anaerolineae bacterium]
MRRRLELPHWLVPSSSAIRPALCRRCGAMVHELGMMLTHPPIPQYN